MKEKIFDKMIEYGWNLGDNTTNDFRNVYNIHYDTIDRWYTFISENNYQFTMEDISKSRFMDFVDFMSDFLRAINDLDKKSLKVDNNIMIIDKGMNNLETSGVIAFDSNLIANETTDELEETIQHFVGYKKENKAIMREYKDKRINDLIKKSFEIAIKDSEWNIRDLSEWNILYEDIDKILEYVENGKKGRLFVNSNIWWVLEETLVGVLNLYDLQLIGEEKCTENEEVISKEKMYLVVNNWCYDFDSGVDTKLFRNKEKAKAYLQEIMNDIKKNFNYDTIEEYGKGLLAYNSGYYGESHNECYIEEMVVE